MSESYDKSKEYGKFIPRELFKSDEEVIAELIEDAAKTLPPGTDIEILIRSDGAIGWFVGNSGKVRTQKEIDWALGYGKLKLIQVATIPPDEKKEIEALKKDNEYLRDQCAAYFRDIARLEDFLMESQNFNVCFKTNIPGENSIDMAIRIINDLRSRL